MTHFHNNITIYLLRRNYTSAAVVLNDEHVLWKWKTRRDPEFPGINEMPGYGWLNACFGLTKCLICVNAGDRVGAVVSTAVTGVTSVTRETTFPPDEVYGVSPQTDRTTCVDRPKKRWIGGARVVTTTSITAVLTTPIQWRRGRGQQTDWRIPAEIVRLMDDLSAVVKTAMGRPTLERVKARTRCAGASTETFARTLHGRLLASCVGQTSPRDPGVAALRAGWTLAPSVESTSYLPLACIICTAANLQLARLGDQL